MKKACSLLMLFTSTFLLSACAEMSPFQFAQAILGYTPPPEETSIGEELRSEFKRCEKVDPNRNCAQIAFDMVRKVKGLEPRSVPKGVVIILEGDVEMESDEEQGSSQPETQQKDKN